MRPTPLSINNLSIDAGIVATPSYALNAKPLDDFTLDQVAVDDLVDVVHIDIRVPDTVGVDDDAGTFLAAVQAARLIDSNFSFAVQIEFFYARFGMLLHFSSVMVRTTGRAVVALVKAEENVTLVVTH